jgi:outer membrane protein assembly factor BamB
VFLTGAEEKAGDVTVFFFAVDGSTGKIEWTREYPSELHKKHSFNSFASPTCTADEERVYGMWSSPSNLTVVALDHAGKDVWKRDLGKYVCRHSAGSSPILFGDLLIFSAEQDQEGKGVGSLMALDARTGEERWKVARESVHVPYSTPFIFQLPGQEPQVIFNSMPHGMTALDPRTGVQKWEMSDLFERRPVGSGFILNDKWITGTCGFGNGGVYLVVVAPPDGTPESKPQLVRKIERQVPYVPTAITRDRLMFLWEDKGIVTCLEGESGKQLWQKRIGGTYFSSPVIAGEGMYNVSATGELVVLAAKEEFEELSRLNLEGVSHSSPAVANGKLFVRVSDKLIAIGGPQIAVSRQEGTSQ